MNQITLNNIVPAIVPPNGWKVGYRIKGSSNAYTIVGPFTSQPIQFSATDPGGTLYEGFIQSDCGDLQSTLTYWVTDCNCPDTYQVTPQGTSCQKLDSIPATVSNAGYCLAPSTNPVYTSFESRIYSPGFSQATLNLLPGTVGGFIFARMTTAGQWANPTSDTNTGPLNREGIWIDSDCNGVKDDLQSGQKTTMAFMYNNPGPQRTIYVGAGADNQFVLVVNGQEIVDTGIAGDLQFKIWHIIPVTVNPGVNYINLIATGDGTFNDSFGMVVYDNTPSEIQAATSDAQLNILFASHTLRFTTYDVATCPDTYSLDTSGGQGAYICTKVLTSICNPHP